MINAPNICFAKERDGFAFVIRVIFIDWLDKMLEFILTLVEDGGRFQVVFAEKQQHTFDSIQEILCVSVAEQLGFSCLCFKQLGGMIGVRSSRLN